MVGAMTDAQRLATAAKYQVRADRIRQLLDWYRDNNGYDKSHQEIPDWERSVMPTRIVVDESNSDVYSTADRASPPDDATWRFNAVVPPHANASSGDELCESVSAAIVADLVAEDDISAARSVLDRRDIVVYRSTDIMSDFNPAFWTHAF